jgi:hypothetical protein
MKPIDYQMPLPNLGDTVLFSGDFHNFQDPAVGWVISVGETTISILTFTPTGFVQRNSVHHRADPSLLGDHGWHDLGCWDFAAGTIALRELMQPVEKSSGRNASK